MVESIPLSMAYGLTYLAVCVSFFPIVAIGMGYEVSFEQPWQEGTNGILHLEHVNVRAPNHGPVKQFYYDVLGFGPDDRRAQNIENGSGTLWANIGTSQVHLPEGDPEVVPGIIGLVYPDLAEPLSRLKQTGLDALDGTKFAWKVGSDGTVDVTCPYGNVYRLHKRLVSSTDPGDPGQTGRKRGGQHSLDPRGGRLPSPPSLGLGIAYVHFRVKPGTAAGIGQFYREVFGADIQEIVGTQGCSAVGGNGANEGGVVGVLVRVGPTQHLGFLESGETLPEYDGHHICVYLGDEGFRRSFEEAERRRIVFVNPRRNFGKADTLEKALDEQQYRIKDIMDPVSGKRLHVLEHEIRSVSHPSYPVGRDLSVK